MRKSYILLAIVTILAVCVPSFAEWANVTSNEYVWSVDSDQSGNLSLNMPKDSTDLLLNSWAYANMAKGQAAYDLNAVSPVSTYTEGGIVYKFQTTQASQYSLLLDIYYQVDYWAARKVTMYYSDVNDFSQLSPMSGSQWGGWPNEFETNSNWQMLDTFSIWDAANQFGHLTGDVTTDDGIFYIRFDGWVSEFGIATSLQGVSFTGSSIPEPATMAIIGFGAIVSVIRRRK